MFVLSYTYFAIKTMKSITTKSNSYPVYPNNKIYQMHIKQIHTKKANKNQKSKGRISSAYIHYMYICIYQVDAHILY